MIEKLPFTNPIPETKLAIDAALKASDAVMKIYNQDFLILQKEDRSPITEADIMSNEIIENTLSASGHPILSEESTDRIEKRLGCKKIWIIDPLDGTTDFVNKTGEFTIMIALVVDNYPVMGVICHPFEKKLYVSQKGQGAYCYYKEKWMRLKVSKTSILSQCRAVGSRFHQSQHERNFLKTLGVLEFTSRGSSLKVLDICCARAEFYFTTTNKINQWDTCASSCLVAEAGGNMTDMLGKPLEYNTKIVNHQNGILVSNKAIHEELVQKYSEFVKS